MLAIHYDITDSTNTRATRLASLNPGRLVLVSARTQTAGRGRSGRAWQSPAGGAWFSVAWAVATAPEAPEAAPIVAGLAVRRAIAGVLPPRHRDDLRLKWPNDVLLHGRKLAGILCERTLRPGADTQVLVVGVGVNANVDTSSLGTGLRQPAVSLVEATGARVDAAALIRACAGGIGDALRGLVSHGVTPDDVTEFNTHLAWRGERVAFLHRQQSVEGVVCGVDRRGRLRLDVDGIRVSLHAGEVNQVRVLPARAALAHESPVPGEGWSS